jgi:hypothetical protein
MFKLELVTDRVLGPLGRLGAIFAEVHPTPIPSADGTPDADWRELIPDGVDPDDVLGGAS